VVRAGMIFTVETQFSFYDLGIGFVSIVVTTSGFEELKLIPG
jgi:hypothetical protein